jgi:hypothetical protein
MKNRSGSSPIFSPFSRCNKMSDNEEFDEAVTLDFIIPTQPASAISARAGKYKPWHKPRKQWIRRRQWHDEVTSLIETTHFSDDARVFRYLSMPGEDMLDVRILKEACESGSVDLRFTGINDVKAGSDRDLQLNLAENAILSLPSIHKGSKILRDKFQAIADPESLASVEIENGGPYHAINVDLCDHLASADQNSGRTTIIDALGRILQVQLAHAMHPWSLFITTRVDAGRVSAGNLSGLIAAISANIASNPDFSDKTASILQADAQNLQAVISDPSSLSLEKFRDFFCLGFGKWLLAYIQAAQPARELTMLPSCYYSVHNGNPDMLSLAFRCSVFRRPPGDAFGLLAPQTAGMAKTEAEMGLELAVGTAQLFDLDALMAHEPDTYEAMTVETEDLLRSAYYPVDDEVNGYRAWLARP